MVATLQMNKSQSTRISRKQKKPEIVIQSTANQISRVVKIHAVKKTSQTEVNVI
jgi:hypothetical protein